MINFVSYGYIKLGPDNYAQRIQDKIIKLVVIPATNQYNEPSIHSRIHIHVIDPTHGFIDEHRLDIRNYYSKVKGDLYPDRINEDINKYINLFSPNVFNEEVV